MTTPLTAAHQYLDQGLSILPTRVDTKRAVGRWKHWQEKPMSHDLAELWWSGQAGQYGIGIITGPVSNDVVVLDVEPEHVDYVRSNVKLPDTAAVQTARGGLHVYCQGEAVRCSKLRLGERIVGDIRGRGGYVVAPPSVNQRGRYEWQIPLDPAQLAPVPEWTCYRTDQGRTAFSEIQPPRSVRWNRLELVSWLPSRLRTIAEMPQPRESYSEVVFAIVLECVHQGAMYDDIVELFDALPIGAVVAHRLREKGDVDYLSRMYSGAVSEYARDVRDSVQVKCHRVVMRAGRSGMRRQQGVYVEVFRPRSSEIFRHSAPMILGAPHAGELSGEWRQFLAAFGVTPQDSLTAPRGLGRVLIRQGRIIRWIRRVDSR